MLTLRKLVFLSALFMLLRPLALEANGDPVLRHCALTLSQSPVARKIPQIQIEKENLEIRLDDGFSRVSVDYVLHNTSRKSFRNIRYGFPVDWEGEGAAHWENDLIFWDSLNELGWSDDYVTDFSFRMGSKHLVARCSENMLVKPAYTAGEWHKAHGYPDWDGELGDSIPKDDVTHNLAFCELEMGSAMEDSFVIGYPVYRRWYYTVFSIKPHETVTLHVEYTLKHRYKISSYDNSSEFVKSFSMWKGKEVWEEARNCFIYDFSPAAAWGDGTARDLNLVVHYPDSTATRSYKNFDFASSKPLQIDYKSRIGNSRDVESVRNHRLDPSRYRILQNEGDSCSYKELSDMDGSTGLLLKPTDSGDFELTVVLDSCIRVTGIVIMNGDCRDSLSWASNGRAEKMMISRLIWNERIEKAGWRVDYAEEKGSANWDKKEYQPAFCKTTAPEDYSFDGLIDSAEKVNTQPRWEGVKNWYFGHLDTTDQIVIFIPKQQRDVYISEIIVLYEDTAPSKEPGNF